MEKVEQLFEELTKNNPLEVLSEFIAPHLIGEEWRDIRKAILLMMATQNDGRQRMRLHTLLWGKAGTGKTELLLALQEIFGGIIVNAEHTSKVGLVGDARGGMTAGLLADYDGNLVLLDELDKMSGKDQSVTGDTEVIIRQNGIIKIIPIEETYGMKDFECLSINPKTLKAEWKKVYKVSRHRENKIILKIETLGGKKIRATEYHSFLKYDYKSDCLIPLKGSNLKVGDLLPVVSIIPTTEKIFEYQIRKDYIGIEELRNEAHIWIKRLKEILPIEKYEKHGSMGWRIPIKDAKKIVPNLKEKIITLPLDYDFGFFVGFWLAEGDICNENIRISQKDKKILTYIQDNLKRLPKYGNNYSGGFITKDKKGIYRLCLRNKYLYNFLLNFGNSAKSKKIPNFCYYAPKEFIAGLLSGYFTGDGCACKIIKATTTSRQLAYGISMLLLTLGIGNYIKIQYPYKNHHSLAYKIIIPSAFYDRFYKMITFKNDNQKIMESMIKNNKICKVYIPIDYNFFRKHTKGMFSKKNEKLHLIQHISKCSRKKRLTKKMAIEFNKLINSHKLDKLIKSDIYWLPIKKIEKENFNGYVYDFCVEDNENFVLANGIVVHNSGLLQAMEEGYYTIVKGKHRERFKAEVRVVATANNINKITKPLLDRFDFIFEVRTMPREERAEGVKTIVENFFGNGEKKGYKVLRAYLNWISDFEPMIEEGDTPIVVEMLKRYILLTKTAIDEVSYRNLELSILRIAYAMAKLEKSNIKPRHIEEAIVFKDRMLKKLVGVVDGGGY